MHTCEIGERPNIRQDYMTKKKGNTEQQHGKLGEFVYLPRTAFLFTARPIDTHVNGMRCTKLVVPSMGSITQVGFSGSSSVSALSSAKIEKVG
jgi:hypothetical protein